ncbi:MAG: phosphoribosylpyrophosphate synthetase [Saprospiraceae bacterium]|nr:phosphoribosylpyrophosphate synthetase [Saprospiraceae bacterium]MDW8484504.1 phosphoribosylpyrophosphate synthetase [Saprospiraceae bacterium]
MRTYSSLIEAIEGLKQEGYTEDFSAKYKCLSQEGEEAELSPEMFHIDAVYRFDVDSAADDQAVLYAISSLKDGSKGILINGYGIYADPLADMIIRKLHY